MKSHSDKIPVLPAIGGMGPSVPSDHPTLCPKVSYVADMREFQANTGRPHGTSQVDTVGSSMSNQVECLQKSGRDGRAAADNSYIPDHRLIKKKELAARLSISPRTVDALVAKRAIPYLALSPRLHLFDLEAVQEALSMRFEVRAEGVRK